MLYRMSQSRDYVLHRNRTSLGCCRRTEVYANYHLVGDSVETRSRMYPIVLQCCQTVGRHGPIKNRERRHAMKTVAVVMFISVLALSFTSSVKAQAESDALRRWDESVGALVRRVSPSVVQITVTGYGTVSEGKTHGNADVVIGRQKSDWIGFRN